MRLREEPPVPGSKVGTIVMLALVLAFAAVLLFA